MDGGVMNGNCKLKIGECTCGRFHGTEIFEMILNNCRYGCFDLWENELRISIQNISLFLINNTDSLSYKRFDSIRLQAYNIIRMNNRGLRIIK
jgi:hypothetical protein